jgi:hypothetical protein
MINFTFPLIRSKVCLVVLSRWREGMNIYNPPYFIFVLYTDSWLRNSYFMRTVEPRYKNTIGTTKP